MHASKIKSSFEFALLILNLSTLPQIWISLHWETVVCV